MGLGRREDFGRQGRKRRQCYSLPSISNDAGQSRNRHKPYTKNLIALDQTYKAEYAKIKLQSLLISWGVTTFYFCCFLNRTTHIIPQNIIAATLMAKTADALCAIAKGIAIEVQSPPPMNGS